MNSTKKNIYLEKYILLISNFVSKKIAVAEFEEKYLNFFKNEKSFLSQEEFKVLDALFSEVDAFCDDPQLRDSFDIDEKQLIVSAKKTLKQIIKLNK